MKTPAKTIVVILASLAGLIYTLAVIWVGYASYRAQVITEFFTYPIFIIGGVLSTNLGAVLGVTLTPPGGERTETFLTMRSTLGPSKAAALTGTPDQGQKIQILACWLYIGSLIIAAAFLIAIKIRPENDSAPLLEELGKTLIGVAAGALMVGVGTNNRE
jgi:hypothetical protein